MTGIRHASPGWSTDRHSAQTRKDEFTAQFDVTSATSRTRQIGSEPAGHIGVTLAPWTPMCQWPRIWTRNTVEPMRTSGIGARQLGRLNVDDL
jgi:hypothetical protein